MHRILQTPVDLGYVERDRARSRYGLTLQLFRLGRGDRFFPPKKKIGLSADRTGQDIRDSRHMPAPAPR